MTATPPSDGAVLSSRSAAPRPPATPPRVVVVAPSFVGAGAERMALSLCLELAGLCRLRTVALSSTPAAVLQQFSARGIVHTDLGKRPGWSPRAALRLASLLSADPPDVLHTHQSAAAYAAPFLAFHRSTRWVHTAHSIFRHDQRGLAGRISLALMAALDARVVAVSQAVEDSFRLCRRLDLCRVIPNGVTPPPVGQSPSPGLRRVLGIEPDGLLLVAVCFLKPPKRPDVVLDRFLRLRREYPALHLAILGDGPLRPALEERVRQAGASASVHLPGHVPAAWPYLQVADIFVHCSEIEGDPLAVKEALASGLPIVAPRLGGVPEVIEHGVNGVLYAPGDYDSLQLAMKLLVDDPGLRARLAAAARRSAARFAAARMAGEYLDFYRSLLP